MAETKRLVCLANSRKRSGHCIAGKECLPEGSGPWIRPVSSRPDGEISEHECIYPDGTLPKLLDIFDIRLTGPRIHPYQSENYGIHALYHSKKAGYLPWLSLQSLVDTCAPLWVNDSSSARGMNDRVSTDSIGTIKNSLTLIMPERLVIVVSTPYALSGDLRRKVRANFSHFGNSYSLSVTDPVAEREFLQKEDGEYEIWEGYLVISLGEPFVDGFCYKLVAAVLIPQLL